MSTPDTLSNSKLLYGSIDSSSDCDWYVSIAPVSGYYDVVLSSPKNLNYNFQIYTQSGTCIVTANKSGSSLGETGRYYFGKDAEIYIKVYGNSSSDYSQSAQYNLYVSCTSTNAWFSQVVSTVDGVEYWNDYNLNKLYCSNYIYSTENASTNVFFVNNGFDLMNEGCAASALAMILRNMDAKTLTDRLDYRTGYTGKLVADPFTVAMANNQFPTITNGYFTASSSDHGPLYLYEDYVCSLFGITSNRVPTSRLTEEQLITIARANPKGVRLQFSATGKSHSIVVIPTGSSYRVYDPGASSASMGFGVTFDNSFTKLVRQLTLDNVIYYVTYS